MGLRLVRSIVTRIAGLVVLALVISQLHKLVDLLDRPPKAPVIEVVVEEQMVGQRGDRANFLLMYAVDCNSSGGIGSAGCLWSFLIG